MDDFAFEEGEATVTHPNELPHRYIIPRRKGDGRVCRKLDLDDIERNV
jgi:hypothetical protein